MMRNHRTAPILTFGLLLASVVFGNQQGPVTPGAQTATFQGLACGDLGTDAAAGVIGFCLGMAIMAIGRKLVRQGLARPNRAKEAEFHKC
jgi:hypothetical protein